MEEQSRKRTLFLVQFSILLAIEAIVCFTPLGSLPPIGPISATLSHIPVILAAVLLGTKAGAGMGFFFGLFSFIVWTFMPPQPHLAFVFTPVYSAEMFQGNFWSIVICFVPRILIGVVAGLTYSYFSKKRFSKLVTYGVSGVLGSLTNTILVLGGIYLFFGRNYAAANDLAYNLLLGAIGLLILTNGIPEAIVGGFVNYAVGSPLKTIVSKSTGS